MKRLIFLILALLVAGSAMAAQTVQVMTNGTIDLDKLPTIDFSYETDPASPVDGQIWWNETTKQLKVADVLGIYEFNATTLVAWDTTPTAFSFTDVVNATTATLYTSDAITVSGINWPAAISVSGDASAKYSINNATAVNTNGTVEAGDEVRAVVTSSASDGTAVNATVTIGGVSDAYSVTTAASETVTYLIDEDFESGEAPSGWSTTAVAYNYSTAPLSGSYSALFSGGGGVVYTFHTLSSAPTKLSGTFLFRIDAAGEGSQPFKVSGAADIAMIQFGSTGFASLLYSGGSSSSQNTNYTLGDTYRIWWELETVFNTTGSRFRVWLTEPSATSRPETPTVTLVRDSQPETPTKLDGFKAYQSTYAIDDVRASESSITTIE